MERRWPLSVSHSRNYGLCDRHANPQIRISRIAVQYCASYSKRDGSLFFHAVQHPFMVRFHAAMRAGPRPNTALCHAGIRFATAVACLPIEALLCRFGIMPEKRLRLRVVILRDANGLEACGRNAVLLQLFQLIRLFKRRANIKVVPFRADVLNGHSSWSANDYLLHDEVIAPAAVLDCRLHRRWALGIAHAVLTWRVCRYCFWQGWRRLPGHGSPLFVFAMADVAPFFYRPAQSLADGRSGGQCNPHGRGHH